MCSQDTNLEKEKEEMRRIYNEWPERNLPEQLRNYHVNIPIEKAEETGEKIKEILIKVFSENIIK